MGEVIRFPVQDAAVEGVRCRTCGFVIVRTRDEIQAGRQDRDECYCCRHNIKLPLADPKPCPDCDGTGFAAVHVCRDEGECQRACPKQEPCVACLGRGNR